MAPAKVLQIGYLPESAQQELRGRYTVLESEHTVDASVEVVITDGTCGVPTELIETLPNLKLIAVNGAGTDAIDLTLTASRAIAVETTGSVLADDVADMAMALLLAVSRQILIADAYVRSGSWERAAPLPLATSLSGKRMGIFGLGQIGQAIARRAEAFGMEVCYFNRTVRTDVYWPRATSLLDLAQQSDILMSVVPGGDVTRHAIDFEVLRLLGPSGFVVNVGRGSVIHEAALAEAIGERIIAGAGLDVFEDEPRVHPSLLASPHVVLQPHRGSATAQTRERMGQMVLGMIERFFLKQTHWI
ncbi:2-hydroxyacid dehydrogenase [Rhizobium binxianense]